MSAGARASAASGVASAAACPVPTVRFAAVTADVGVGRRLPFVADVSWQIHSVQEMRVLLFAMNGPLPVFGMVFVIALHECTGRGMWIGWIWRRAAGCRLANQSCIHSSIFSFCPFQYAAKDLATIC